MSKYKITRVADEAAVKENIQHIMTAAQPLKDLIVELQNLAAKGFNIGGNREGTENLRKGKEALTAASAAMREYQRVQDEILRTQARIDMANSAEAQALARKRAELAALNREQREAAAAANGQLSAYQKLEAELKKATALYREYYLTLGAGSDKTKAARDRAMELNNTLREIDQGVGNFRRNVGNYAASTEGLGFSIRNIASELPNLGISLRTFGQSISNNITPFYQAIKQLIDQNRELRAQGQPTVNILRTIGREFLSLGTFINIAIIAGLKLIEYFEKQNKAVKGYQKALEDAVKTESEHIAKLKELQVALSDNTLSRDKQLEVFNRVKKEYPQYFQSIQFEENALISINKSIEAQIALRLENAKAVAAQKNVAIITEELIKKQQDLNKEIGFWERWDPSNRFRSYEEFYSKLTDSAKKLADEEVRRNKQFGEGANALSVRLGRIREISDAERRLADAVTLSLHPLDQQREALEKEIKMHEERLKAIRKDVKGFESMNAAHKVERDNIQEHIRLLNLQLNALNMNIEARERQRIIDKRLKNADEIELLAEKNKVLATKEGTKERLLAEIEYIKERKKQQLINLKNEYGTDVLLLQQNKEFMIRRTNIERSAQDDIQKLRDSYARKNKPKKEAAPDIFRFDQQNLKDAIAVQQAILNNEKNTYRQRLEALRQWQQLRLQLEGSTVEGITKVNEDAREKQEELEKKYWQDYQKLIINNGKTIQLQYSGEYAKQIEALRAKNLTERQFNREAHRIRVELEKQSLDAQINSIESERFWLQRLGVDVSSLTDEYQKLKEKRDSLAARGSSRTYGFGITEADLDNMRKAVSVMQEFGRSISDAAGLFKDLAEQRISSLESQKTAEQDRWEREMNAIESSTLSEEQKQQRIGQAKAQQAAAEERMNAKIREQQRKAAAADKAAKIASIIAGTAAAVVNALSLPFPFNIIAASTIGAIGAAQLSVAVSAPLPQYAEGTDDHPGGKAILGDGKERELVVEPGKSPYWSAATDTVYDLPKHTKVIPESQLASMANGNIVKLDNAATVKAVYAIGNQISGVLQRKKDVVFEGHGSTWDNTYYTTTSR